MYSYSDNSSLGKATPKRKAKQKIRNKTEEKTRKVKGAKAKRDFVYVDTINEQVKFLRRFKSIANTKDAIPVKRLLTFIKALQRAIHERKIRKSDRYAEQFEEIQRACISAYQRASSQYVHVKVPTELYETVSKVARTEKIRPSVAFLKRFVGMIGRPYHEVSAKMRRAYDNLVDYMFTRGMIRESDPYFSKVKEAERALLTAIKNRDRIKIPAATLEGLNGVIAEEEDAAGFL